MLTVLLGIVIVAIVGVVIFFVYKEYTSSRSYRVNKSVKNFRKIKKEEEKTILKFKNDAEEIFINPIFLSIDIWLRDLILLNILDSQN